MCRLKKTKEEFKRSEHAGVASSTSPCKLAPRGHGPRCRGLYADLVRNFHTGHGSDIEYVDSLKSRWLCLTQTVTKFQKKSWFKPARPGCLSPGLRPRFGSCGLAQAWPLMRSKDFVPTHHIVGPFQRAPNNECTHAPALALHEVLV